MKKITSWGQLIRWIYSKSLLALVVAATEVGMTHWCSAFFGYGDVSRALLITGDVVFTLFIPILVAAAVVGIQGDR